MDLILSRNMPSDQAVATHFSMKVRLIVATGCPDVDMSASVNATALGRINSVWWTRRAPDRTESRVFNERRSYRGGIPKPRKWFVAIDFDTAVSVAVAER